MSRRTQRLYQKNFLELAQDFLYKIGRNITLKGNEVIDFTDDFSRARIDLLNQTFQRYGEPFYENYGRHHDASIMLMNLIQDELLVVNDVTFDYHGRHTIPRLRPAMTLTRPAPVVSYDRMVPARNYPQYPQETHSEEIPKYRMKKFLINLRQNLARFSSGELPRDINDIVYITISIKNPERGTVKDYEINLYDYTITTRAHSTETIDKRNAHELFKDIKNTNPGNLIATCFDKNDQISYSIKPAPVRAQAPGTTRVYETQVIQREWQVQPQPQWKTSSRAEKRDEEAIQEWVSPKKTSPASHPQEIWPNPTTNAQGKSSKLVVRQPVFKGNQ